MKKAITNTVDSPSKSPASLASTMSASQVPMKAGTGWLRRQ
jgi:hypothetical protein